ncbi:MAG: hypothetical protein II888_02815 [Clostridia bacterium]|nr:hypothetical protein [Clostridia bacterium]
MKKLIGLVLAAVMLLTACFAVGEDSDGNPFFSGEWLEKDTQFTVLDVTRKISGGWEIELTSPVSHGAWVIRGTAFFDSGRDAFVYSDGVKRNLPEQEGDQEQTGLQGTLRLTGTEDSLQVVWCEEPEGNEIIFERAPALPAYEYTGADEIEGAVANALAQDERAALFLTEPGYVTIPCPIIHRTEMTDDSHATVYGSFWIQNYVKRGTTLESISGGEYAGIMTLEKADGKWKMTGMQEAGDGDDYAADIESFAAGDSELAEKYFAASDLLAEPQQTIRTRLIRDYVEANHLGITAYHDFGWDPVDLAE